MLQSAPPHLQHSIVHLENMTWCTSTLKDRRSLHGCRRCLEKELFDELELMLMAMFEQPTLKDTIQVLLEVQPLVAEDAEMAALVQQTIPKMQQLNEQQFKGLELEWYRPEDDAGK